MLVSRAEVNGLLVIVDNGTIHVQPPDTGLEAVVQVEYGSTMLEFEAEMDARTQWKSVEAKAWDYTNQTMFEHVSDSAPVSEAGNIDGAELANTIDLDILEFRHGGQVIEAELQQWTDAGYAQKPARKDLRQG